MRIIDFVGYIEFVGGIGVWRHGLTEGDLRSIGEFTRENIVKWYESRGGPGTPECFPIEDLHAVCGNNDIPWATKEGCDCYRRVMKLAAAKTTVDPDAKLREEAAKTKMPITHRKK